VSEEMSMEQMAAAIDAADQGTQAAAGAEQNAQTQGNENDGNGRSAQGQEPAFDTRELRAFMEQQRQFQNRINSELGGFRKRASEMDKYLNQTKQAQAPKSFSELPEQDQKSARELIKHLVEQEFGERFKSYDGMLDGYQLQRRNERIMDIARSALGDKFGELDGELGNAYMMVKNASEQGNHQAETLLNEIHSTESGVYRLIDIARNRYAQSMQTQSNQAKLEQEGKAKRAASGVGGSKTTQNSNGADGLPTDAKDRQKAIADVLDKNGYFGSK
jgi:hypothetical protein